MFANPSTRGRRLAVAATLVAGLTLAPAGTAAAKPKPTAPAAKCKPGAIKKVGKGTKERVYVCDTKGKWIEVVAITGEPGAPGAEGVVEEPTAERALKPKVDPKPTRCMVAGGVYIDVGEVIVETQYVRDEAGNVVSITHHKYLCGADGNLYEVFAIRPVPSAPSAPTATTPEKTR